MFQCTRQKIYTRQKIISIEVSFKKFGHEMNLKGVLYYLVLLC